MTAGLSPARLGRSGADCPLAAGQVRAPLNAERSPREWFHPHRRRHAHTCQPHPGFAPHRAGQGPRECIDPDEMADLEAGLWAVGRVIQPIFVRSIPGTDLSRSWPASAARAAKNVHIHDLLAGHPVDDPYKICDRARALNRQIASRTAPHRLNFRRAVVRERQDLAGSGSTSTPP